MMSSEDCGSSIHGSVFGKRDLLAIFHIVKHDVKCGIRVFTNLTAEKPPFQTGTDYGWDVGEGGGG